MREFNCVVCGTKAIDNGRKRNRKFCSKRCSDIYYGRIRRGTAEKPCTYNEGVACFVANCKNCGWHPEVEKARKEKLYGQIG